MMGGPPCRPGPESTVACTVPATRAARNDVPARESRKQPTTICWAKSTRPAPRPTPAPRRVRRALARIQGERWPLHAANRLLRAHPVAPLRRRWPGSGRPHGVPERDASPTWAAMTTGTLLRRRTLSHDLIISIIERVHDRAVLRGVPVKRMSPLARGPSTAGRSGGGKGNVGARQPDKSAARTAATSRRRCRANMFEKLSTRAAAAVLCDILERGAFRG